MKLKLLSILVGCGLIVSSNAFAYNNYMTESQKSNMAHNQYDQYQGKHAKTAAQDYSHLNDADKGVIKSSELHHRENIHYNRTYN